MTDCLARFEEFLAFHKPTPAECLAISRVAGQRARANIPSYGLAEREQALEAGRTCAFCGTSGAQRNGRDPHGNQRYRCRSTARGGCGRTFTALTGTPFSGMKRRDQWGAFLAAMASEPRSINALHASGEVAVARLTLFRWRHRFPDALRLAGGDVLAGKVEADATNFRRSFQGSRGWKRGTLPAPRKPRRRGGRRRLRWGTAETLVPVVTAIDHTRNTHHAVLPDRSGVAASLANAIAPGSVLCTDGEIGYRQLAAELGLQHVEFRDAGQRRLGPALEGTGLGRVNQFHERLKSQINHVLRGVSTARLTNYVEWLKAWSPERLRSRSIFAGK